jgi:2-oxoglutarate ferredoxin oxidoreductase subunit beta
MTKTYEPGEPIWCAGCGHYGVRNGLTAALRKLEIPSHETVVLAGIGCSGTLQNNVKAYGYHALHGRVLPSATGVALANPKLNVVAVGGDGDGYAIGAGHLVHTFKRNPNLVYVLMNNGVYGLTKGQNSPSAMGGAEVGVDGAALGLSISASTFIARGYSGHFSQLEELMAAALDHARSGRGFAFLEVLSPCVTYNDTYPEWVAKIADVTDVAEHDPGDRSAAFGLVTQFAEEGRLPTGVLFQSDDASSDAENLAGPAQQDVTVATHLTDYRAIMERYAV